MPHDVLPGPLNASSLHCARHHVVARRRSDLARVLDLWVGGELEVAIDARIDREYRVVFAGPALDLAPDAVRDVLDLLDYAEQVVALPLPVRRTRWPVAVVTPRQFIELARGWRAV